MEFHVPLTMHMPSAPVLVQGEAVDIAPPSQHSLADMFQKQIALDEKLLNDVDFVLNVNTGSLRRRHTGTVVQDRREDAKVTIYNKNVLQEEKADLLSTGTRWAKALFWALGTLWMATQIISAAMNFF